MEPQEIDQLITKWNPHFSDPAKGEWVGTVLREKYLQKLAKVMGLRHIIILTGVRRSGKSTLMRQLMGKLVAEGVNPQNLLYLYFEDLLVQKYLPLGGELLEQLYSFYRQKYNPQGRVYVFLDELQGVKEFNHWLHSHYEFDKNVKFIISGSRRSLVESDTATVLTGRNLQFNIYPFNFCEYLQVQKMTVVGEKNLAAIRDANFPQTDAILHHLGTFLYEGGYPEIVLAPNKEGKMAIANGYYRDILTRDVVGPNNIRNGREIEILGLQILTDFTQTHTYRSLGTPQGLSVDTVKSYLNYFYNSYVFFESRYFSYKTKEIQDVKRPIKLYAVDNGLRNFNTLSLQPDIGKAAENAIFTELKKESAGIFYWKAKKEIDFAVLNPNLTLINSSYTDQVPEREVTGLLDGLKEFRLENGLILTKNCAHTLKSGGKTVEFVPLWAWLIYNSLA